MSRTLKLLLVPLAVLAAVAVYLAASFAGASDNEPPPREPVVLPSDTTSPSAPSTSPSAPSTRVPVVTPGPIDDDDDDDDRDDRDDDRDDD